MVDRTDERTKERERSVADAGTLQDDVTDFENLETGGGGLADVERTDSPERSTGSGRLSGLRSRLARLFSPRRFLVRAGALAAGLFGAGFVPLLPGALAGFLGVAVAGFAIGFFEGDRSYLETGTAGLLVGSVAALLNHLVFTIAGLGGRLVLIGAVSGLVGALIGLYFGRDLRAGLSKEL